VAGMHLDLSGIARRRQIAEICHSIRFRLGRLSGAWAAADHSSAHEGSASQVNPLLAGATPKPPGISSR